MKRQVLHTRYIVLEIPRENHPLDPDCVQPDNYRTRSGIFSRCLNDAYLYKHAPKNLTTWCKSVKATFVARREMQSALMVESNEKVFTRVADFSHIRNWVGFGWVTEDEYTHIEDVPAEIPIVIDRRKF